MAQYVGRALGVKDAQAVLLADGLLLLLGEVAEDLVVQGFPELGDDVDQALAIDQFLHHLQQIHHDRRTDFRQVEELGGVKADDRGLMKVLQPVGGLVEDPAEGAALAPASQPLEKAVLAGLG